MWSMNTSMHSKYAKSVMGVGCEKARWHAVNLVDCYRFHVKDGGLDGIVSLNMNECSCRQFQCLEISCSHAIVVARERNINPFTLCSRLYSVEYLDLTYAEWKKPPGYIEVKILPPEKVVQVGQQRVNKIPSVGEYRAKKCGRCGGTS